MRIAMLAAISFGLDLQGFERERRNTSWYTLR